MNLFSLRYVKKDTLVIPPMFFLFFGGVLVTTFCGFLSVQIFVGFESLLVKSYN